MPTICIIKSRKFPVEEKDISDGGTLNVFILVRELLRRGYNVDVFTRNEGDEEPLVQLPGMRVFRTPFTRSTQTDVLVRDFEEGASFIQGVVTHPAFQPASYLSIHTHHWTSGVGLPDQLPATTKLVHTPHLLASEKAHHNNLSLPDTVHQAEQAILGCASHIVTLSKSECDAVMSTYHISADKIIFAPNGIDSEFFDIPHLDRTLLDKSSILFVGRSCRQKGIDVLLDAAEQIAAAGTPYTLHLVGGNYWEPDVDREVTERVSRAPLAGNVHNLGRLTHDAVLAMLSTNPIYTQPSRYESQGIALLEAMAAGRVVVASRLPAIEEYITHGENGLLVEPENHQQLADSIQNVLGNPERSLALGRAARETARRYTWQRMLDTVVPLLET